MVAEVVDSHSEGVICSVHRGAVIRNCISQSHDLSVKSWI